MPRNRLDVIREFHMQGPRITTPSSLKTLCAKFLWPDPIFTLKESTETIINLIRLTNEIKDFFKKNTTIHKVVFYREFDYSIDALTAKMMHDVMVLELDDLFLAVQPIISGENNRTWYHAKFTCIRLS